MNKFKEQYENLFSEISHAMGNKWRVNQLTERTDVIKLTSPAFNGLSIYARRDNDRLVITGHVPAHWSYSACARCTVSVNRPARQIASDIKRKILPDGEKWLAEANEYQAKKKAKKENDNILKGVLGNLAKVSEGYHHNNTFCFWDSNKISGSIEEICYDDYYRLKVNELTKDELIRVIGFISTLRSSNERSDQQTDS
ncbi:hypothetical protein ABN12_004471 [Salmonella enterica subsp. enterica serovar Mississippi]|uniref:Uncharacterized protein n=1 Tax=Salmonella enterica subsp. enterica serovar Cardoner TaxID=2564309 RepID=A0A5V6PV54_SALET|nr:hypothetical protein [Salmonella enterica]EAB6210869.1 hypothetical protein [Salmonella enterica subsp. enterica serovar Agbeni]EAC1238181.1 hypothetical protein [Salmonella enterica subsp. enterica]EBU8204143.1 hypothetical protein [Salmonella enterica subsp. enterica serovar Cardoner]EBW9544372.1 hypothetical protein [Salmonella enterica subsp. enterica serovar Mississippi]ECB1780975.1 hypothetical protein [Salmonella enterica subsp. enterica serovar Kibi]ECL8866250.1 hypothetical protei